MARCVAPPDLFCLVRQAGGGSAGVEGCVISEGAGGRWPGPFPTSPEPILAFVSSRAEVEALGLDWRVSTWPPLRGSAGSAEEAESRLVVVGDSCLLVRSLRRLRNPSQPQNVVLAADGDGFRTPEIG